MAIAAVELIVHANKLVQRAGELQVTVMSGNGVSDMERHESPWICGDNIIRSIDVHSCQPSTFRSPSCSCLHRIFAAALPYRYVPLVPPALFGLLRPARQPLRLCCSFCFVNRVLFSGGASHPSCSGNPRSGASR
jgi:hypothetical protein